MLQPRLYFLLAALIGTFVLSFFIFRPFLYALVLAMIFAVVFQPIYQKIKTFVRGQQGLAALVTILIVVVFIFTPLVFLGIQLFKEAEQLYFSLANGGGKDVILNILNNLRSDFNIDQYLKQGLDWLIQRLGSIFSGFAKIMASSFIFLIALYYLLKDGYKLKASIIALSPLLDANDEIILKKLEMAINSVMRGNLLIALIQGTMTMAGFVIFGVPNAVLWGSVAAVAALIPGIGTALVLIPAIVFLFLQNETFYGIGLIAWGMGAVGLIDNFLGPKLIGRGMHLHPLIILLSVFGGIAFFGPIGFLLGPLTATLLFALLDIYSSLILKEKCTK
jgi:predicted PurR-regulated permease PerM